MSLHPTRVLDHVIEEYRDYLRTEFRAKDLGLRQSLEQALDERLFLSQEPFYQAHRPFQSGKRWRDLPMDPKLAAVMEARTGKEYTFLHQSEAIIELLSPTARPVVVTTGTGSGKTEAFLLPVLQNALEDVTRFRQNGLTAILVYPMNALANDQLLRIEEYLQGAGFSGAITVAKYDRGTKQADREHLRNNPPHILLTNYMMLEYLLVRPADREGIFANHRCRFLVLDEVHTYRGTLGSNLALLVRRVRAHLERARQDWAVEASAADQDRRFPKLVPVGTSATIKSVVADGDSAEGAVRQRDKAVQEFFGKLTGVEPSSVRVLGETVEEIRPPEGAIYSPKPQDPGRVDLSDPEAVRRALCVLAGQSVETSMDEAARRCRLLWDLNRWLVGTPMSIAGIVERLRAEVPERRETEIEAVRAEVEAALMVGAALPDHTPGVLRLRAHRLLRGGWRFHRCVNPDCWKLYPMGQDRCECGHVTAPLFLCRNCGADYLRFVGDPTESPLRPSALLSEEPEWMLYEPARLEGDIETEEAEEDEEGGTVTPRGRGRRPTQMKQRPVLHGSFDPRTLAFSEREDDYPLKVILAPARTQCLCCGGSAGSRKVVTPVALGTSAAVKVVAEGLVEALAEANKGRQDSDGKERLLIFSDSRQDASHQARFIRFVARYDRMRRNVVQLLAREGPLPFQRVVELLGDRGTRDRDNPYAPQDEAQWVTEETRQRIRAWEEAPLLDNLSVNAGYRGTLPNLGLVAVRYDRLGEKVQALGADLSDALAISTEALEHLCRCLLDEIRIRGAFSRELLRYHPQHPAFPAALRAAEWERRVRQPRGYAATSGGDPELSVDTATIPAGITLRNAWRRPGAGGRAPSLQRILTHLVARFGGKEPTPEGMRALLRLLKTGRLIDACELYGARDRRMLLQVNAEAATLALAVEAGRMRCGVCGAPFPDAREGLPCPHCHGALVSWTDVEVNRDRGARRIRSALIVPLVAEEHTAQVPNDVRSKIEEDFKAAPEFSKTNVLACSPTLEMGIDVGGMDAVVLRNVPPRPDNYAQRGGRAGRRLRVGLVLGYARNTPHDQYFYDHPEEMIAGEVPAPAFTLGNRDVLLRHLSAIAFGAASPGLAGRMVEYVSPMGEVKDEVVAKLVQAVQAKVDLAIEIAQESFGQAVLAEVGISAADLRAHLERLPDRIRDVMERTARQVIELRASLDRYARELLGARAGQRAGDLVARLLGLPREREANRTEADDRSAGYPLRRLAEFGILPGYEFPAEPASLRLLGDEHEEEPVTVGRHFGIAQFQPAAQVFARTKRWRVVGLDTASPWNPRIDGPTWVYRLCGECGLRFSADQPRCPRCKTDRPGQPLPAAEFGGFLAVRDESPILDEEDRYAMRNLVVSYPQWDGDVVGRWRIAGGWALRHSRGETVPWLNEGLPPTPTEAQAGLPCLHADAKGFLLCSACGRMLKPPENPQQGARGRRQPIRATGRQDPFGHADTCPQRGTEPRPVAIVIAQPMEVLRLIVPAPDSVTKDEVLPWGLSLGYALRIGMRRLYMLDGPEIEFLLEGPWKVPATAGSLAQVALSFVDPSLGGTGYLRRIAEEFHLVARKAVEHLDHKGCEDACYRCLKSYANQRFHDKLRWPLALPYLEVLAESASEARPLELGDIDDPGPWLEAYAAGVGSPLELKFLRLFEQHGFRPQKQVPIAAEDGGRPITIADFAVPERRLAIYVDGAAFHVGAALRRDRYIRERLRRATNLWRVEELRAKDLAEGEALVRRLELDM